MTGPMTEITAARLCRWVRPGEAPHPLPPHKRRDAAYCDSTCRAEATRFRREGSGEPEQALRPAQGKPITQCDRALYELRNAGERGVRSDTFDRLGVKQVARRIYDLRRKGHEIDTVQEDHGIARYILREPVAVAATSPYSPDNEYA